MPKKQLNDNGLTNVEQAFADRFISNGENATVAYMLTKPNSSLQSARVQAHRILHKPEVQKYLELRKQDIANRENIDLGFLVTHMKNIMFDVAQEQVERDERGRITSKPDRQSSIKAADLLAKLAGFYNDKQTVNIQSNGELKISFGDWEPEGSTPIDITPTDVEFTDMSDEEEE